MAEHVEKRKGQKLRASELNQIARAAFRQNMPGSHVYQQNTPTFTTQRNKTPWFQRTVEITNLKIDDDDTDDSGLYLCKPRFYDPREGYEKWKSSDKEWKLDASDLGLVFAVGDKTVAYWDGQRGFWIPIAPIARIEIRRFELKDDLSPGNYADAYPLPYEDGYDDPDIDHPFRVYDAFGCFRGRGNNKYPIPNHNGSRGYVLYYADSDKWEIIWMVPNALLMRGVLDSDLAADSSFTLAQGVTGVHCEVIQPTGGIVVDHDPVGGFDVMNPFHLAGIEDDHILLAWDTKESPDQWSLIQVEHHELEVVTDYRVDGANLKLQKKVKTIHTMFEDDDYQTWVDVHIGTKC